MRKLDARKKDCLLIVIYCRRNAKKRESSISALIPEEQKPPFYSVVFVSAVMRLPLNLVLGGGSLEDDLTDQEAPQSSCFDRGSHLPAS